jgi:hypothetical protein
MRAWVLSRPGSIERAPLELREIEAPGLSAGEIQVSVRGAPGSLLLS